MSETNLHKNRCKNLIICLAFVLPFTLFSQHSPSPVAAFLFNNGEHKELISGEEARVVGAQRSDDRFGNKNNAIFLFGSEGSYISLGRSKALKPQVGSISLWVNVEDAIWSGSGYTINPIILTKRSNQDDFFESYIICYHPEQQTFAAWCSKDSSSQISISSRAKVKRMKWYHLVITYNDEKFAFYVNGELQAELHKGFRTEFLESDSVLVGYTANAKNKRYLHAAVDDILFFDHVLNENEVQALYESPDPNRWAVFWYWFRFAVLFLLLLFLFYLFIRWQSSKKLKRYQDTLKLQTRLLETELRVNRALMNPHFIFNSLNSIQNLILNNLNEQATQYLLKFSKLIRKILESNTAENITLADEIDILQRYLELEQLRFQEDFVYQIQVDPRLKTEQLRIPIMMVQPFVENSIWHGLMNKSGERLLQVSFKYLDEQHLLCVVEDNGIGRREREQVLREKKSLAIVFVQSRLELINKMHHLNCSLNIIDKAEQQGTIVELKLPLLK